MTRPFRLVRAAVLAALAVCGAALAVGGSGPSPSTSPTPGSSPVGTVGGSPGPSSSPAASAPLGPETQVVLRIETGGGLVPWGFVFTQLPTFTLYADGSVIIRPTSDPTETGLPPLWRAELGPEQANELVRFALEDGGLASADDHYEIRGVADAPTTIFTIHAQDIDRDVSVNGLGIRPEGPERKALKKLERLASRLAAFESEVLDGGAITAAVYQPPAYAAGLFDADPEEPGALPWPWPDLTPDDWERGSYPPSRELSVQQVALVTTVPSGGHPGVLLRTPDGRAWRVPIRPLLPDREPPPEP